MVKRVAAFGCWLIAALLLPPAAAQVLYKSTLPDGRIVYGDKPVPDAVKVEETRPDISKHGIGGATQREKDALQELEKARMQREAGQDRVRAAEQALREAEAARDAGKEPLASERLGTAGGKMRITDDYYARQKTLDEAVDKARRDLEAARSGR